MSYVPIRLSTLTPGIKLDFRVFLHMQTNNKYLLYVQVGDELQEERYQHLKSNRIRQLFIEDQDEQKYQQFLDRALESIADNPHVKVEDKADFVGDRAGDSLEKTFQDPGKKENYQMTEKAAQGIIQVVAKGHGALKALLSREHPAGADKHLIHAINVASLATTLAGLRGLAEKDQNNIGVAAMLLDIGKVQMPQQEHYLFTKDTNNFSKEEWAAYKKHPALGVEMMQDKPYVNGDILKLIENHEERKSGNGFPKGKTDLSPDTVVVAVCSCYDRKVSFQGMGHKEAIQSMSVDELGNFDLPLIQDLKKVLKKQGLLE